jgi:CRISPR-associated protein Cmr1
MTTRTYTFTFLTPAFLGDAEQSGRWRTPPVKASLRQWWRVVYAADHRFAVDVDAMQREEGSLFGNAWLSHRENGREISDHRKSLVRLRLDRWTEGDLKKAQWPGDAQVIHPEVTNREGKAVLVGSSLYLGYGPLTYDNQRRATVLKNNAAIQAGEGATLSLAWPTQHPSGEVQKILDDNNQRRRLERALWLMDRYGTLGGRSRNGWGSFILTPTNGTPTLDGQVPVRDWKPCLEADWPHAIGEDDKGPLVWQTAKTYDDWKTLMRDLAIIKIGLRTQFVFPNVAPPHQQPLERHWLSYPITRHTTRAFDRSARLPNSLRFKVRCAPEDHKKLVGVIFHIPCSPSLAFNPDRAAIERTWKAVHTLLDELCSTNGRTYPSIANIDRRKKLEPELNKVVLKRISE